MKHITRRAALAALAAPFLPRAGAAAARPSVDFSHGDLRVAANGRFLQHADGAPFFYLGDTAWELFHRLRREEIDAYLANRRAKGFTVIQAVVLAEFDGLHTPNAYGAKPLAHDYPGRPEEAYFELVDYTVTRARENGLYIGMLPTWGDKVTAREGGIGPVVFNPANARVYGRFLGERYGGAPNIIWILGGDRTANGEEAVWRAMATGIQQGDGGRHLITYHPRGGRSSSQWFQNDRWLAFNMLQSGHSSRDLANYDMIAADYNRTPVKPVIDGESRYEDHPINWNPKNGWFDDFDVRQAAYWALFAGAPGHTYGCHDIWQFWTPARKPISSARTDWHKAIDLPGSFQMQHARGLLESRPFFSRVPDQGLLAQDAGSGADHVQATRGYGYAFVYVPTGKPVRVAPRAIGAGTLQAWWYDPRTGESRRIGKVRGASEATFTPPGTPSRGNDWVLVLDDAERRFARPGVVNGRAGPVRLP